MWRRGVFFFPEPRRRPATARALGDARRERRGRRLRTTTRPPTRSRRSTTAHERARARADRRPCACDGNWANMSAQERNDYMIGVVLPIEGESFAALGQLCAFPSSSARTAARTTRPRIASRCPSPLASAARGARSSRAVGADVARARRSRSCTRPSCPEVATMLGLQPYSAEHQDGFGCFGCHPHAQ